MLKEAAKAKAQLEAKNREQKLKQLYDDHKGKLKGINDQVQKLKSQKEEAEKSIKGDKQQGKLDEIKKKMDL